MRHNYSLKIILLILLVTSVSANSWDTGDTIKESVFQGLLAVDTWQTLNFNWAKVREMNPILGTSPSNQRILIYNFICAGTHLGISRLLPNNWLRDTWQYVSIGVEAGAVCSNWRLKIMVGF